MLKPCVVAFVGWALLGEPLGLLGAAGLAVSLAGVLVLVQPPSMFGGGCHAGWGRARLTGTAAALSSSAFAAGVAFSIRRIGKSEAALTVRRRLGPRPASLLRVVKQCCTEGPGRGAWQAGTGAVRGVGGVLGVWYAGAGYETLLPSNQQPTPSSLIVCTRAHTHTQTHTHTLTHKNVHACVHTHARTHARARTHTHTHTHMHARTQGIHGARSHYAYRNAPRPKVALAFHSCTLALSAPPLALSWPQPAVPPSGREAGLLVAIALTSFAAQLLLTRCFQLMPAGQASALSFTSVIYGGREGGGGGGFETNGWDMPCDQGSPC